MGNEWEALATWQIGIYREKSHLRSILKVNFFEAGVARRGNWDEGHLRSGNLTETLTLIFSLASEKNPENRSWNVTAKVTAYLIASALA